MAFVPLERLHAYSGQESIPLQQNWPIVRANQYWAFVCDLDMMDKFADCTDTRVAGACLGFAGNDRIYKQNKMFTESSANLSFLLEKGTTCFGVHFANESLYPRICGFGLAASAWVYDAVHLGI